MTFDIFIYESNIFYDRELSMLFLLNNIWYFFSLINIWATNKNDDNIVRHTFISPHFSHSQPTVPLQINSMYACLCEWAGHWHQEKSLCHKLRNLANFRLSFIITFFVSFAYCFSIKFMLDISLENYNKKAQKAKAF